MRLIDTHCHLDFPELAKDRAGVLARAAAAGVARMITISTEVEKFPRHRRHRRERGQHLLFGRNPSQSRPG